MKGMNRLIKVSDISKTMQEMQKEMTKAGVIDEMVSQPSAPQPPCRNPRAASAAAAPAPGGIARRTRGPLR